MSDAPTPDLELGRHSAQGAELLALLRESMAASVERQRLENERLRRELDRPPALDLSIWPDLSIWKASAIGVGIGLTGAALAAVGILFGKYVF